jgi:phosphatidylinositol-4,5-bisphosphate 4-phosphatase
LYCSEQEITPVRVILYVPRSSVGPDFARSRGILFLVLAFLFLLIGVGVTVGTYSVAAKKGGLFVAYVGAFLVALIFLARSIYYCSMKISTIEGGV